MISVNDFVSNVKKESDLNKYIKKHIVNEYVNYDHKIDECKEIVELSSYKEVNGQKVYWKDTPKQYFVFVWRLIKNYTDIDMDSNTLDCYNELNKNGLIDAIISNIPEKEYLEFKTILEMTDNDLYVNTRDIVPFLETKVEAMKLGFDGFSSVTEEISKNQEQNISTNIKSE